MCACAGRYAEMYDMFALIDGGGAGVSADDDSKIQLEELKAGIEKVNATEWVALKGKTAADAEALFKEMDDDGAGEVLLVEWCEFLKRKEIEAGTDMGKLLSLGDSAAPPPPPSSGPPQPAAAMPPLPP